MDLTKQVKKICQIYNISPARSKGQNFLINDEIIKKIIATAELKPDDVVLEVGPGLGILTEALVKKVRQVISVELDRKLFDFLQTKFVGIGNLELINEDILTRYKISRCSPSAKSGSRFARSETSGQETRYKVVANLPYNITSHFLKKFLTAGNKPSEMILLIQKEVAERICAKPLSASSRRSGQMSLLAISVQLYGKPEIIEIVSRQNFWPVPKVDSAILKIVEIKNQQEVDKYLTPISEKLFWQIVRIGFSAKRKQLQNNLASGLHLPAEEVKNLLKYANFDPKIRAQSLSVDDWLRLAKVLSNYLG